MTLVSSTNLVNVNSKCNSSHSKIIVEEKTLLFVHYKVTADLFQRAVRQMKLIPGSMSLAITRDAPLLTAAIALAPHPLPMSSTDLPLTISGLSKINLKISIKEQHFVNFATYFKGMIYFSRPTRPL